PLEDGTRKIFVNMTSRNGRPDLVSLLQYMKNTTLDNPDILVKDERILDLDRIVGEVKQSEEWEAVKMNILEIGLEQGIERGMAQGIEQGIEQGMEQGMVRGVIETCQDLGISQSETLIKLIEKFSMGEDAAREQLEKYWR
ncbi:MAG: hypothetical protein K2K10_05425, partial [Acetatifactor sp.]|nr:hypothetical protein [Acetatifactor sp.]